MLSAIAKKRAKACRALMHRGEWKAAGDTLSPHELALLVRAPYRDPSVNPHASDVDNDHALEWLAHAKLVDVFAGEFRATPDGAELVRRLAYRHG